MEGGCKMGTISGRKEVRTVGRRDDEGIDGKKEGGMRQEKEKEGAEGLGDVTDGMETEERMEGLDGLREGGRTACR